LLDGAATVAIALLASGDVATGLRLGGSMVALQASIGALNDVIDERADAGRKPGKPIPSGLVTPTVARVMILVSAMLGGLLASMSGPGTVALAALALGIGYGYDLWAKGTTWSWLPFAIGIPLLPVFAWFGATDRLPGQFAILLPAAVAAGAALAIANARADLERDTAAGHGSVAARLGLERAWWVSAGLLAAVLLTAAGSLWLRGVAPLTLAATMAAGGVIVAGLGWARPATATAARRERAWEIQAIGVAVLAAVWLAGIGDRW
jgi:4-hydroxybenzoate polyprenyltransferase/geranylgeranylglycerol-phosphate geranylgeranyltransferase